MNPRTASRGASLLELLFTLCILAVLLGLALPPIRRAMDRYATRAARDALLAGVARTRAAAVARGGARLVVDVPGARFWTETLSGDTLGVPAELGREYRVELAVDGASPERVVLRFDALGLGRVASRTFRLRRGETEAGLTLSSYGRPRPW